MILTFYALLFLVTTCACWSRQTVESAFHSDGWLLKKWANNGSCTGAVALAANASVLASPKMAFFFGGGTPYERGVVMGKLAEDFVAKSAVEYVDRLPAALIDQNFAKKNSTLFKAIEKLVGNLLSDEAARLFDEMDPGVIPVRLVSEMRGVLDGCLLANPKTKVTWNRLVALNFGFDVISARLFSGHFLGSLLRHAEPEAANYLRTAADGKNAWPFLPGPMCDAVGVRKSFLSCSSDQCTGYFGRAFQLPTAGVIQNLISLSVIVPSNRSVTRPLHLAVHVPGMVGAVAGINEFGVSIGVDTLRAANANNSVIGLNSLLMIRTVLSGSSDLQSALSLASSSQHNVPYIYPMCDGTGACAVAETGRYVAQQEDLNPLQYVEKKLKRLLPTSAFLNSHPMQAGVFRNGMFVRHMNFSNTNLYADKFNPSLFKYAKFPYNASKFELGNFLFDSWQADDKAQVQLQNNYFFPQKEDDSDLVVVSNFAIVPEERLAQMEFWSNQFARTGKSMFWRYEMLVDMVLKAKGTLDFDSFTHIMSFLSPDRKFLRSVIHCKLLQSGCQRLVSVRGIDSSGFKGAFDNVCAECSFNSFRHDINWVVGFGLLAPGHELVNAVLFRQRS